MPVTYFNQFNCRPSYGFVQAASSSSITISGAADDSTQFTAGETIFIRDAIFEDFDGLAYRANALSVSSSFDIGFAISGAISGSTFPADTRHGKVLDGFSSLLTGSRYFLSESAGLISELIPENTGSVVYQAGIAKTATELIFYPELLVRK